MKLLVDVLRTAAVSFIEYGTEGATPQKALLIRRARGFGLVAFVTTAGIVASSLLAGRPLSAYLAICVAVVYGTCLHFVSREHGRYAELSSNVAIAMILASITVGCLARGDAPASSVTYPSLMLLGTMHVLGVRTAAVWTLLSLGSLALVSLTAVPPLPAPGVVDVGPVVNFISGGLVIVGVFAIAALGRRFEDRQTAQLEFLAQHDPLTGLCNRRECERRLAQALERGQRYAHKPALLFIDLDNFKQINDQYGHAVGDEVLRGVARALDIQTRRTDVAGRIGGDEFVVVLEDTSDSKDAKMYAKRLLESLCATESEHAAPVAIRASVGVALFPDAGRSVEELTRAADAAMYRAKRAGGNRVVLAEGSAGDHG